MKQPNIFTSWSPEVSGSLVTTSTPTRTSETTTDSSTTSRSKKCRDIRRCGKNKRGHKQYHSSPSPRPPVLVRYSLDKKTHFVLTNHHMLPLLRTLSSLKSTRSPPSSPICVSEVRRNGIMGGGGVHETKRVQRLNSFERHGDIEISSCIFAFV